VISNEVTIVFVALKSFQNKITIILDDLFNLNIDASNSTTTATPKVIKIMHNMERNDNRTLLHCIALQVGIVY